MGREGAKQDTHLFKTQWHDKTEASRGRETSQSSQAVGSLPTCLEPVEKHEDRLGVFILMKTVDADFSMNFYQILALPWWTRLLLSWYFKSPRIAVISFCTLSACTPISASIIFCSEGDNILCFLCLCFYLSEIHSTQHKQTDLWTFPWNLSAILHHVCFHQIPSVRELWGIIL